MNVTAAMDVKLVLERLKLQPVFSELMTQWQQSSEKNLRMCQNFLTMPYIMALTTSTGIVLSASCSVSIYGGNNRMSI